MDEKMLRQPLVLAAEEVQIGAALDVGAQQQHLLQQASSLSGSGSLALGKHLPHLGCLPAVLCLQFIVYAVLFRQLMQTFLHKIGVLQLLLVALHFLLVRIQPGTQLRQLAHIVLPNGVAAADGRRGNTHAIGPNDPLPLLRAGHILTCGTGAQDDPAAAIRNTGRQR